MVVDIARCVQLVACGFLQIRALSLSTDATNVFCNASGIVHAYVMSMTAAASHATSIATAVMSLASVQLCDVYIDKK